MAGQFPEPLRIDGRDMWDRASIDDAIDRLFGRSSAAWEDSQPGLQSTSEDWRKRQPGLQP